MRRAGGIIIIAVDLGGGEWGLGIAAEDARVGDQMRGIVQMPSCLARLGLG